MTTIETRIAEVLKAHALEFNAPHDMDLVNWDVACDCGWAVTMQSYEICAFQHAMHQTAMLAPLIREAQAKAWDKGMAQGQDLAAWAIGNRPDSEKPDTINPYRKAES